MKLKFINIQEVDKSAKCAVHKTGKLGFNAGAIEKFKLSTDKTISIAVNEDDPSDENLYVVVNDGRDDISFPVCKAGDYFYLNTKTLFDKLSIDYRAKKIIYDIVDFDYDGIKMYKLIKREVGKKIK